MNRPLLWILVDGEPVPCDDAAKWSEWYTKADRQVADDRIAGVRISTVFLGLDHGMRQGLPLLYETMIFGGGDHNREAWRYHNRVEALEGHRRVVELVLKNCN